MTQLPATHTPSPQPTRRPLEAPAARRWQRDDHRGAPNDVYTQGALALTFPLPGGLEAWPRPSMLTLVTGEQEQVLAPESVPDPEPWAARLVQAVVEVVSSDRPLTQLARWTDPRVYDDLRQRRARVAQHRRPGQVRAGRQLVATVHVRRSSLDSAEVAARVTLGSRSRAIAARLDFQRGRWLCTAICFG